MLRFSRGQALVESVFFLPIMLLALFAVIYFSQFGSLAQRVQVAIRFGSLGQFVSGSPPMYSAANIYLSATQPPSGSCPAPPIGVLYNTSPFPGPPHPPYWQPLGTPIATSTCNPTVTKLQGAQFLMSRYLVAGHAQIQASTGVPSYLAGLGAPTSVSASESWVHAAWPTSVLACIKEVNSAVEDMLTNMETVALPSGWTASSGC